MQLKQIQGELKKLEKELNSLVEKKINLSYNLERFSNWLFGISVIGAFIAIFCQFWVATASLGLTIIGCVLLIYKSWSNLTDVIDINLWLAERCTKLYIKCSEMEKSESALFFNEQEDLLLSNECIFLLEEIRADRKAYHNGMITSSLDDYYEKRYTRSRYSAALKNRYNKHGIKQTV
jgi:hypothetical protein